MTDGPNGARGGGSLIGGVKSAAFPVGIALGATWNVELVREIGAALAQEVKSKGAHMSLSPTVNIHRSVTNGRNFECYSEDPILTARLAVAFVRGLQGQGVAATIKHFVGNESEIERTTISSEIDERTLREVYLVPFEAAVKEAGTWGVMSSYNRLNGTFTSENEWLLTEVLRHEWDYDGVGDVRLVRLAFDRADGQRRPGSRDAGPSARSRRKSWSLPSRPARSAPRRSASACSNVLRLMERTGALDDHRPHEERADDRPEHRALIRRAGAEGAVLLKNDGMLPLDRSSGKIAVIGPNAKAAQIMGGGSAQLNPHYQRLALRGPGHRARRRSAGLCRRRHQPPLRAVARGALHRRLFRRSRLIGDAGSHRDAAGCRSVLDRTRRRRQGRPAALLRARSRAVHAGADRRAPRGHLQRRYRPRPHRRRAGRRRVEPLAEGPDVLRGGLRRGRRHHRRSRRAAATPS